MHLRSHCRLVVLAAALLGVVQAAKAFEEPAFQFKVKVQATDVSPRCTLPRSRCRDDLALQQVVETINRMAVNPASSPFGAIPKGTSGVEIVLGQGIHRILREVTIRRWPAAGRFGPLTIKGMGADKTVLSGAVSLADGAWAAAPREETRITAAARDHVRAFDVSRLPLHLELETRRASGFDQPSMPLSAELMVDGDAMTIARWPNSGWALVERTAGASRSAFAIAGAGARSWSGEPDLFVAGYLFYDWAFERLPADGDGRGAVRLPGSASKFGVRSGQRVRIENALSELDVPGEWFLDRSRRLLYFWPLRAGPIGAELALTATLLGIVQSEGITVQDLSIKAATGDAVRIQQSRAINLKDLLITNVGNRGVVVEGGSGVTLQRLLMHDLGEGGVTISGGDRATLTPSGHIIEECRIERFARHARSYRPAVQLSGVGIHVLRNRIADGPHSAIVFNGNDHRIEGNHISDVVTETNDAGAVYTGRDWTARGTVFTNNLIQNVYPRLAGASAVMGIYLDDQASGTKITSNVFANVTKAVFIGGGRDNAIVDNIFVRSSPAVFADSRGSTWQRQQALDVNGPWLSSYRSWIASAGALAKRYPHLLEMPDDEPGRIKYNTVRNNLFVESKDFEFQDDAERGISIMTNLSSNWSIFKKLRSPKAQYSPDDFELSETATFREAGVALDVSRIAP